jgi:hypothetical protein
VAIRRGSSESCANQLSRAGRAANHAARGSLAESVITDQVADPAMKVQQKLALRDFRIGLKTVLDTTLAH